MFVQSIVILDVKASAKKAMPVQILSYQLIESPNKFDPPLLLTYAPFRHHQRRYWGRVLLLHLRIAVVCLLAARCGSRNIFSVLRQYRPVSFESC